MYIRMNQSMSKCAWPLGPGSCPFDDNIPFSCLLLTQLNLKPIHDFCTVCDALRLVSAGLSEQSSSRLQEDKLQRSKFIRTV